MSTELTTTRSQTLDDLMAQATAMLESGLLPPALDTPQKVLVTILRGRELGIGDMEACLSINVISGKVSSATQLMLAMIYKSKVLENIEMIRGDPARVTMKRKGMSPHTVLFGSKEAHAMNLMGKDNYKKQPETMFMWRAIAICSRLVCPDVVSNLYTPDELGMEINSDNVEVQASEWTVLLPEPTPTLTPEQLEEARTRHADGMSPSKAAEWLSGILGKEITRGDVGQILPELYG